MASTIDTSKPVAGNPTTQSVRDNFAAAKSEIEALQVSDALKAPIASPTFTGTATIPTVDINGGAIDGATIGASSPSSGIFTTVKTGTYVASVSGSVALNPANGGIQKLTMTDNVTFTDSMADGDTIVLMFGDSGTARTITWPASAVTATTSPAGPELASPGVSGRWWQHVLWKVGGNIFCLDAGQVTI